VPRFPPGVLSVLRASWQQDESGNKVRFQSSAASQVHIEGAMRDLNYEQSHRICVRGGLTIPLDAVDLAVS